MVCAIQREGGFTRQKGLFKKILDTYPNASFAAFPSVVSSTRNKFYRLRTEYLDDPKGFCDLVKRCAEQALTPSSLSVDLGTHAQSSPFSPGFSSPAASKKTSTASKTAKATPATSPSPPRPQKEVTFVEPDMTSRAHHPMQQAYIRQLYGKFNEFMFLNPVFHF